MKHCISSLLSIFILSSLMSCRMLKDSDLVAPHTPSLMLPALQGEVNNTDTLFKLISIGNRTIPYTDTAISYGDTIISGTIEIFQTSPNKVIIEIDTTENISIPEERVFDMIKLFASEINTNINDGDSVKHGIIELELHYFKERRNPGLIFMNVWWLCMPCLFGVPVTGIHTELEIQVVIKDLKGKIIQGYKAYGEGKAFVALYWGYGYDAWRKSNILAFNMAMDSIKKQMRNDEAMLRKRLLANR